MWNAYLSLLGYNLVITPVFPLICPRTWIEGIATSTSVILFLLPEAKVELRLRVIKQYHMSEWDLTGFYPSVYIYIHNHLPVIKSSASATIRDMIGYFCEIHLHVNTLLLQLRCYKRFNHR